MLQTFLLFDTITNEKTVKFMQRDIIKSTITWHLGLLGSNHFGEYTSFSLSWFEATPSISALQLSDHGASASA